MSSVNKVHLLGRVGRDPEARSLNNGMTVANISLATSSKRKDKVTGETIETTEWHRVQFFDKLADIVVQYVHKGDLLYVEGRLKYGKYTDKDGIERNTADIVATEMQLLGGKRDDAPQNQARTQAKPKPANGGKSGFDDMDDDIPF